MFPSSVFATCESCGLRVRRKGPFSPSACCQESVTKAPNPEFRKCDLSRLPLPPPTSNAFNNSRVLSLRLGSSLWTTRNSTTTATFKSVHIATDTQSAQQLTRLFCLNFHTRNKLEDPTGHLLTALSFGTLGYFEYHWELRADELIALKREEIAQKRRERMNPPPEV